MTNHLWWRAYVGIVDNSKVQSLPDRLFKQWINMLCIAKRHGGTLPTVKQYAFEVRQPVAAAKRTLDELVRYGLLESSDGVMRPHHWDEMQYSVTPNTERQRRFRERHAGVTSNAHVMEVDALENDLRTRVRASDSVSVSVSESDSSEEKKGLEKSVKPESAEILDEQFAELRKIARDRGVLPGGSSDWTWAFQAWRVLDFQQKALALADVANRPADTPEMEKTLPQNYIKGRKWERPMPKVLALKLSRREEARERFLNGNR